MNWFERYGIPGIYFVSLLSALYFIIFGFTCIQNNFLPLLGIALSASFPIGYILCIFSQLLYYTSICPWRVHIKMYNKLKDELKIKVETNELLAEAEITILARLECSKRISEGRWIQEWLTKRFDVMAINSALICGTVIAWIFGICCWIKNTYKIENSNQLLIFILISLFIFIILILSNILLTKQAVYINTKHLKKLLDEEWCN